MRGQNVCFYGAIRKIIPFKNYSCYPFLSEALLLQRHANNKANTNTYTTLKTAIEIMKYILQ